MLPYDIALSHITARSTMIYGLKFLPSLEPHVSDNQDTPAWGWPTGPEISDCNLAVVSDVMQKLGKDCQAIVEIGVHRNQGRSITNILMDQKPTSCKYLGIDIDDKSHLNNSASNIFTFKSNSHDQRKIRQTIAGLGISTIDILMIDGWHSVNTCVNDWCYTDLLSHNGCVVLHDTNAHPGCLALFHAVDEKLFIKKRHCTSMDDMGIATFWHTH
jgi:hypothetical protein